MSILFVAVIRNTAAHQRVPVGILHNVPGVKIHSREDPLSCPSPSPMVSCWAQSKPDGDTENFLRIFCLPRRSQQDLPWHIATNNANAPVSWTSPGFTIPPCGMANPWLSSCSIPFSLQDLLDGHHLTGTEQGTVKKIALQPSSALIFPYLQPWHVALGGHGAHVALVDKAGAHEWHCQVGMEHIGGTNGQTGTTCLH